MERVHSISKRFGVEVAGGVDLHQSKIAAQPPQRPSARQIIAKCAALGAVIVMAIAVSVLAERTLVQWAISNQGSDSVEVGRMVVEGSPPTTVVVSSGLVAKEAATPSVQRVNVE